MAVDPGGIKLQKHGAVELDPDEVLHELEQRLDRLKVLYEQFFMGMEKMAPSAARKDVERRMRDMTQAGLRNTAHRYRLNSLTQRFGSLRTYWTRVEREIEKGTHVRTLAKVSREAMRKGQDVPDEVLRAMPERMRQRLIAERSRVAARVMGGAAAAEARRGRIPTSTPEPAADPTAHEVEEAGFDDLVDNLFDSITTSAAPVPGGVAPTARGTGPRPATPPPMPRAATPPPMPRAPPPPPGRTLPAGMSAGAVDALYERYVAAKKQVGDDTRGITPDALARSLAAQTPKLLSDHQAQSVDYAVIVRDNRVILKATPKK